MPSQRAAQRFLVVLLIIATTMVAFAARPLAVALLLACCLATVLWPLKQRLRRALHDRNVLATSIVLASVIILLLVILFAFAAMAYTEIRDGLTYLLESARSQRLNQWLDQLPAPVHSAARRALEELTRHEQVDISGDVQQWLGAHADKAAGVVRASLSATGELMLQTTMMFIALYPVLLQGDQLIAWLDRLSPLRHGQTRELLGEFRDVTYSVVVSTLVTSSVQAAVALIGYLFSQLTHVLFFTAGTFLAAFIPAIGAGTICVLAAMTLLISGHPYSAVFLAVWGVGVVSLVDNLVKPLIMRGRMRLNGVVVFLSLIGGLGAFGAIGILLGPLSVVFFLTTTRFISGVVAPTASEVSESSPQAPEGTG